MSLIADCPILLTPKLQRLPPAHSDAHSPARLRSVGRARVHHRQPGRRLRRAAAVRPGQIFRGLAAVAPAHHAPLAGRRPGGGDREVRRRSAAGAAAARQDHAVAGPGPGRDCRVRHQDGGGAGRVGDIAELSPRRGLDPHSPA